jgi:hypothetical protein
MPQYDLYHVCVRNALLKDGWRITDDPYVLLYKELRLYIDLAAEKPIAAEKAGSQIAVEVKVFSGASFVNEFERALGQFVLYRSVLNRVDFKRKLYLAIPSDVYEDFFSRSAIVELVAEQEIHLLVFDPKSEEITKWTS